MKRVLTSIVLVFATSAAIALPSPTDIAAAVNSGNLPQAETMLHEVIKEKPGSAKAHYELGQVLAREGRKIEARQELLEAQRLDPSLKFASSPQHFNDLLNKVPAATHTAAPPANPVSPPVVSSTALMAPAPGSFPWGYLVLAGGAVLLIWLFMRRNQSPEMVRPAEALAGNGVVTSSGFGYGTGGYSPAQAPGSGISGAVLGGVAGLAAGYGLAKVLENNGDNGHRAQNVADDRSFTPIEPAPQADFGAFDAGTGDSWDSGDASFSDQSW